ncbi:WD repeat-containing protein 74-like [Hydractinia symbiolongicarpus]|uniref:WD repeat-containing protein 74-like n=1 Tax=Hydractinia symbiolongicarpus TaxID=13093 RepID=UPI00254B5C6A|nr:WD repeat-containing protein 74-like [Hydractinia symbiolongicarpus]
MEKTTYDAWVGSELGLLKGITLSKECFVNYGNNKFLDKNLSITSMAWQDTEDKIYVGLRNGIVKTFNTQTLEYGSELSCDTTPVRGIIALPEESLIVCSDEGKLKHFKQSECLLEKTVGDGIKALVGSSTEGVFATGGQENDLKIWQIDAMDKPLFSAKNVRNDFLNLRVPIWISAIDFFRQDCKNVVVGTGHHSIRVYDRRDKRRPVIDMDWRDHPITALSVTCNNNSVVVGNSASYMDQLDFRTGKPIGAFKGNNGSIRSIKCHDYQPYVVAGGLDRFLKVYDLRSRTMLKKIYMKSNVNCVELSKNDIQLTASETGSKRKPTEDKGEEEDAGIWESMETVHDKKKSMKKKISSKKKKT